MSMGSQPRICIIGAGPCGLTALKNLLAYGLDNVTCYDESDAIGGNWVFSERPGRTSVHETTHIISSKALSAFEDFPMSADYPEFPSHRQMRAYFESYADYFKLATYIQLRTRVEQAKQEDDGRWSLQLADSKGRSEAQFDYLIVCSGHHRESEIPAYPGHFSGESLHSADFKRAARFGGKRVLVVGGGNSACDIAVDVARVAAHTCISMRRGYHIVPKIVFGRPVDSQYLTAQRIPRWLQQPVLNALLRLVVGRWKRYGLQAPTSRPLETHPTLNSSILDALSHGTVLPRVGIERLDGNAVRFRDGTVESFDTIIWATGFKITYPFLDSSVVDWDTSRSAPLYRKMMHGRIANLYFIGLFQPIGCIWRLADYQGRIAALQIAGRLDRPADIAKRIEREMHVPHWNFDVTARHAVEVDYHRFRKELLDELSRGGVTMDDIWSAAPQRVATLATFSKGEMTRPAA